MNALKVLFIGGNGTISAECSRAALAEGMELTHLNRGSSALRPAIPGVSQLTGNALDPASLARALGDKRFDVVVNFHTFTPDQMATSVELFRGRVMQYVFISSASVYSKPVTSLPIREGSAVKNPWSDYARGKIECEQLLWRAYRDLDFPATVVRPSHTYDETHIPLEGGWIHIDRMRRGKPVVVHGDGTSLWTMTHSRDFARGLVGILGNPRAIGETYQITSDETLTWDAIAHQLGAAAGVEPQIVHVTSEAIARRIPAQSAPLLGDKAHSVVFDNTKIKELVPGFKATTPFWRGAQEIIQWFDAAPERRWIDRELDAAYDDLVRGVDVESGN